MHRLTPWFLLATLPVLASFVAADDHPKSPRIVNLEKLNTADDEDEPHLGSGGTALYFARNVKAKWSLQVATRRAPGQAWGAGQDPDGYFDDKADNRGAFLTPDGKYPQYLYFASNANPEKKDHRGDNFDLYVSVRQKAGAAFTTPTPVQSACTEEDEEHPWLTADGKDLYFSRKTKDGWRVYEARAAGAGVGAFEKPKLVELPAGYHHATLTPDGKTMYLQGPLEKERWGLFRSTFDGKAWSTPEALDEVNNADGPTGDRSPALSRDGATLYFASDRPGGKGGLDLYAVLTAELKKK
jgi:WD40-like Beta Propeller Repeat